MKDGFGFLVNRVARVTRARFEHELAPYGVTAQQWPILRLTLEFNQPRPSDMAEAMCIDRGAVTRLIDRLVEKGLVNRIGDPDDRRAARVELTETGRALVPGLVKIAKNRNEMALSALAPEERQAIMASLGKILEHMNRSG